MTFAQPVSRIATAFRALRSRNYRLFFSGQIVSLAGTWAQQMVSSNTIIQTLVARRSAALFASRFPKFQKEVNSVYQQKKLIVKPVIPAPGIIE